MNSSSQQRDQQAESSSQETRNERMFDTLEKLVLGAEKRGETPNHHVADSGTFGGPLSTEELSHLSRICAEAESGTARSKGGCGFGAIDSGLILNLLPLLGKHVGSALAVDIMKEANNAILGGNGKAQNGAGKASIRSVDEWLAGVASASRYAGPGLSRFRIMWNGLEAASILVAIMASPGVDQRVINEDLVATISSLFRHFVFHIAVPSLSCNGYLPRKIDKRRKSVTPGKKRSHQEMSSSSSEQVVAQFELKKVYNSCHRMIHQFMILVERLSKLIDQVSLEANVVFSLSSASMELFAIDPSVATAKLTVTLQGYAVSLLSSIVHRNAEYRATVIEDFFPIMLRLPTSRRTMRLFEVQAPFNTKFGNSRPARQLFADESGRVQSITILILSMIHSCAKLPHLAVDGTVQSRGTRVSEEFCSLFSLQLLRRCDRKGQEGGASEFRPILMSIVEDLLKLHLLPHYPAADMLLMTIIQVMKNDLSKAREKSASIELTYTSTIFDVLGMINAEIADIIRRNRESPFVFDRLPKPDSYKVMCPCNRDLNTGMVQCDRCKGWFHLECMDIRCAEDLEQRWLCEDDRQIVHSLQETDRLFPDHSHSSLIQTHVKRVLVLSVLSRSSKMGLAREFCLASWIDHLAGCLNDSGGPEPYRMMRYFLAGWESSETPLSGPSADDDSPRLSKRLLSGVVISLSAETSSLVLSFPQNMALIMDAMSNKASSLLRKLAVKAVAQVIGSNPKLMVHHAIKNGVQARARDRAVSVREAVVKLIGTYVLQVPEVADAFHESIIIQLTDSGKSVRKSAVKIFRDILLSNPKYEGRASACVALLRLAANPKEEDIIRDLIHDLFLEMWLESGSKSPTRSIARIQESTAVSEATCLTPANTGGSLGGAATPSTKSEAKLAKSLPIIEARARVSSDSMIEVVLEAGNRQLLSKFLRNLMLGSESDPDQQTSESKKRRVDISHNFAYLVDALMEHLLVVEEKRGKADDKSLRRRLLAVFRTLGVFAEVAPSEVHRHTDVLHPYLKADNGLSSSSEAELVTEVCDILHRCSSFMKLNHLDALGSTTAADDLVKITYKCPEGALCSAVRALSSLAQHPEARDDNIFAKKISGLSKTFYRLLRKHVKTTDDFSNAKKALTSNIQRALSVLGSLCRFHESVNESDDWMDGNEERMQNPPDKLDSSTFIATCYCMFHRYLEKKDSKTKCAALRALGGIFVARPKLLLVMQQDGTIESLLKDSAGPNLQFEAIRCWREIILAEEDRVESGAAKAKMDSNTNITVSKRISGDQDSDATIAGGVMSKHGNRLFQLTSHQAAFVRTAALDLLGDLLRQGLVNPMDAMPFLLALQGDLDYPQNRAKALKLLIHEGHKRPDMLRQRIGHGIKQAYMFQRKVKPSTEKTSALIVKDDERESIFSEVFTESVATDRKQRRGLFRTLLSLFDLKRGNEKKKKTDKEGPQPSMVPLLSFASEVLGHLPYMTVNDPLYIINQIQGRCDLSGVQLIDKLTSFLQDQGVPSVSVHDELNVEPDSLELAAMQKHPSQAAEAAALSKKEFDILGFVELCEQACAFVLLLRLKSHLKVVFSLSEIRCFQFRPEAKEQRGVEKVNSTIKSVMDSSMPKFFVRTKHGLAHVNKDALITQYAEFRQIMRQNQPSAESELLSDDEDDKKEAAMLPDPSPPKGSSNPSPDSVMTDVVGTVPMGSHVASVPIA